MFGAVYIKPPNRQNWTIASAVRTVVGFLLEEDSEAQVWGGAPGTLVHLVVICLMITLCIYVLCTFWNVRYTWIMGLKLFLKACDPLKIKTLAFKNNILLVVGGRGTASHPRLPRMCWSLSSSSVIKYRRQRHGWEWERRLSHKTWLLEGRWELARFCFLALGGIHQGHHCLGTVPKH